MSGEMGGRINVVQDGASTSLRGVAKKKKKKKAKRDTKLIMSSLGEHKETWDFGGRRGV